MAYCQELDQVPAIRQNVGLRQRQSAAGKQRRLHFCTPLSGLGEHCAQEHFFLGRKSIIFNKIFKRSLDQNRLRTEPLCLFNRNNVRARKKKNRRRTSFHYNSCIFHFTVSLHPLALLCLIYLDFLIFTENFIHSAVTITQTSFLFPVPIYFLCSLTCVQLHENSISSIQIIINYQLNISYSSSLRIIKYSTNTYCDQHVPFQFVNLDR